MSLVKCKTCEKSISSNASACPSCGEPVDRKVVSKQGGAIDISDPVHLIGVLIVIGLVVSAVYLVFNSM